MTAFTQKHCVPCEGGIACLAPHAIQTSLAQLEEWTLSSDGKSITRDFKFKDYYQTMAFVNAIAWMAHHENHHPDLEVGYSHCQVNYRTHAIDGLSENDFICAAKVNTIFSQN